MNFRLPITPGNLWRVVGVMSGTSADGVDAVCIEVDPTLYNSGQPFRALLGHHHAAYPAALRSKILQATEDALKVSELTRLQRVLGDFHATCVQTLLQQQTQPVHLISLHGQTVQHHPQHGASLQLADPYVMTKVTGVPVVWDLRRVDLAYGGQGAPLVPKTEQWLRGTETSWVALNLGGIANVTVWDQKHLRAWDTGPGMSLLDIAATWWLEAAYDVEGAHATGRVHDEWIHEGLRDPYFGRSLPKSTGREYFGRTWLEARRATLESWPLADRFATLAAFTAESIAHEWRREGISNVVEGWISGGGRAHPRVIQELKRVLPELHWHPDDGLPTGTREAVSWALLGAASAAGQTGNHPEVTGASQSLILGSWTFPQGD